MEYSAVSTWNAKVRSARSVSRRLSDAVTVCIWSSSSCSCSSDACTESWENTRATALTFDFH